MELRIETFRTKSELEVVRDFWSSAHAHRDADFEFYQFIGKLFPHIVRPHVIAVYRDGEPKALILGRLENRSLDIRVGYWRLRTRKLRTLTIVHGGVVGDPRDEDCEAVIRTIIHSLRAGEAVLARFESLAVESPLYARAIAMPGFAHSDHFTNPSVHYARSAGDKAFLESLSSHERNNHRRRTKRLLAGFPSAVRIKCFGEIAGLDQSMCDVEEVARKSYQRGLGVGFVSSKQMRRRLEFESRKGWLRGYILYIEDRPCAFWIGSLRDGTFYSDYLGYDPDRAEYSPGMYLVINVLEELFGPKNPASALDFGGGEGDWKAILSNRSWREAPVHVFAPTFRGLYLNFLWSAPAMINVWAKNILNRTNLMARVKKKWRAKRAYKER